MTIPTTTESAPSIPAVQEASFDITKAQTELGWKPRFSNNEMFVQSYDWYLQNREAILRSHGASHHRSAVKQGVLSLVKHLL